MCNCSINHAGYQRHCSAGGGSTAESREVISCPSHQLSSPASSTGSARVMGSPGWSTVLAAALSAPHHRLVQGMAATPATLAGSCGWAQVLLHHLSSTEGTEVGLRIEAVAVSMLPWFWSRMEEEQRGQSFSKPASCLRRAASEFKC